MPTMPLLPTRRAPQVVHWLILLVMSLVLCACSAVRLPGAESAGPAAGSPGTATDRPAYDISGPATTGSTGTGAGIPVPTGFEDSDPVRTRGARATPPASAVPEKGVVRVFYGTDRDDEAPRAIGQAYGNGRSTLKFGYVDVSIPREHRMGKLERPSLWRLEFKENPEKHITLVAVQALETDAWRRLVSEVSATRTSRRGMVFVHGFNVSFDDAARRAGQLAYDLGFDGLPFLYSWPSVGSLPSYTIDEANIEWTAANLRDFLKQAYSAGALSEMVLIAHSMGSRALARVVADIASDAQLSRSMKISHLILAAPDIDADVFARDLLPKMGSPVKVTIYTSSKDRALNASRQLHGYDRLGYTQAAVLAARVADVIDASEVDTSLLGHSYYGDHRSVIADMFGIITLAQPIDKRFGLQRRVHGNIGYWEFKP